MAQILMINDEPALSPLLAYYLISVGHSVTVAANALESMIWLYSMSFDVVVVEIAEYADHPFIFCRTLKSLSKNPHIRLLALGDNPQKEATAVAAGADAFLAQPVWLTEVRDLVLNLTTDISPTHALVFEVACLAS